MHARWALATTMSLALAGAGVGCGGDDEEEEEGRLDLQTTTDSVRGSYRAGDDVVRFSSSAAPTGAVEVTLELHGMTLVATVDELGAADLDAFATSNAGDTRLSQEDRDVLARFVKQLHATTDERHSAQEKFLRRFAHIWSEYPSTLDPKRLVLAQENRSYSSLCGYNNNWWYSTHDGPWLIGCNSDRWEDKNSYYGYISAHGPGSCNDGTNFWVGYWSCFEPDHRTDIEYAYGNCFGNCGSGCDSAIDFTVDCADHDSCVRFGHDIAAVSCDDEFSSTLDDWGFAPTCFYI